MNCDYVNENGNGAKPRKQTFDFRDPQHWSIVFSGGSFVVLIGAVLFFADVKNQWKNHCESNERQWKMTWTYPEMIQWVNADSKVAKVEHADPYEIAQRFKDMKRQ